MFSRFLVDGACRPCCPSSNFLPARRLRCHGALPRAMRPQARPVCCRAHSHAAHIARGSFRPCGVLPGCAFVCFCVLPRCPNMRALYIEGANRFVCDSLLMAPAALVAPGRPTSCSRPWHRGALPRAMQPRAFRVGRGAHCHVVRCARGSVSGFATCDEIVPYCCLLVPFSCLVCDATICSHYCFDSQTVCVISC